jgi:hypothetical protein
MKLKHYLYIAVWILGSLFYSGSAVAELWQAKRILVFSSQSESEQMAVLSELLDAHLQDLDAYVTLEIVEYSPRDIFDQVESARKLVRSRGAFSAIWVERSKEEVFLFVSDNSTHNVFLQTFEGSRDGWEVECEAIVALVRSALITWLAVDPETTAVKGSAAVASDETDAGIAPSSDKKSTPVSDGVADSASDNVVNVETEVAAPPGDRGLLRLTAGVGYAPRMFRSNRSVVTHDVAISAGVRLLNSFFMAAGVRIGPPLDFNVPDPTQDIEFRHYPVSLSAGWIYRYRMVELVLGASFLLNITYLKDKEMNRVPSAARWARPGGGVFGRVGVRVLRYFSIFAAVGSDFFKECSYEWEHATIIGVRDIQPSAMLGVEVISGSLL